MKFVFKKILKIGLIGYLSIGLLALIFIYFEIEFSVLFYSAMMICIYFFAGLILISGIYYLLRFIKFLKKINKNNIH
jgi:uncharacterized membrane protein HdeD (DUF308 family)